MPIHAAINPKNIKIEYFLMIHEILVESEDGAFVNAFIRAHVHPAIADARSSIQINARRHPARLVRSGVDAR